MSVITGAKLRMRFFVIFLIVIISLSTPLYPQESSACSCATVSTNEAIENSVAIFSGTVTKITESYPTWPITSSADPVTVEFQVDRVWKGVSEKTIKVKTPSSGSSCGYGFEMGKTYLVYSHDIQEEPPVPRVSLCSRTAPISDASEDLDELGIGKMPNEVEKIIPPLVDSVIAESPDYSIQTVFKVTSPEDCHGGYKDGSKGHFEWFDGECLLVDFDPERFHRVPYKEIFAAPLKQVKAGIALVDVQCNEGKHVVYKYDRMRAACLTDEAETQLLKRGWAALRLGLPATDDISRDLCNWYGGEMNRGVEVPGIDVPRYCDGLKYPLLCSMAGGDITETTCSIP